MIGEDINWPSSNLNSLRVDSQMIVLTNAIITSPSVQDVIPVMEFDRFSSFVKRMRVLLYVFELVFGFEEIVLWAWLVCQSICLSWHSVCSFRKKKTFFLSPSNHEIPPLVANLDLFLGDKELIRSRERIENPNSTLRRFCILCCCHHITVSSVMIFHRKCKHLGIEASLSKLGYLASG